MFRRVRISLACLLIMMTTYLFSESKPIGVVTGSAGNAWIKKADGTKTTVIDGGEVYNGDTLIAGNQGYLEIELFDGSDLKLTGDSKLIVEDVIVDPKLQSARMQFSTESGRYYFSGGRISRVSPDQFRFITPHGDIGIHGSAFTANVTNDKTTIAGKGAFLKTHKKSILDFFLQDKENLKETLLLFSNNYATTIILDPEGSFNVIYFKETESGKSSIITEILMSGSLQQRNFSGSLNDIYHGYLTDIFKNNVPAKIKKGLSDKEIHMQTVELKHFNQTIGREGSLVQGHAKGLLSKADSLSKEELQREVVTFAKALVEASDRVNSSNLEFRKSIIQIAPNSQVRTVRLENLSEIESFNKDAFESHLSLIENFKEANSDSLRAAVLDDIEYEGKIRKSANYKLLARALVSEARAYGNEGEEGVSTLLLESATKILQKLKEFEK